MKESSHRFYVNFGFRIKFVIFVAILFPTLSSHLFVVGQSQPPFIKSTTSSANLASIETSTPFLIQESTTAEFSATAAHAETSTVSVSEPGDGPVPQPELDRRPFVVIEQILINGTFDGQPEKVKLNYTLEINKETLKEQRIVELRLLQESDERFIITCSAPYPVKWVTNIPIKKIGQDSIYEMSTRAEVINPLQKRDSDSVQYEISNRNRNSFMADNVSEYKIRLNMSLLESGRVKCESMNDTSLFTDYYIYKQAGPQLVSYGIVFEGIAHSMILSYGFYYENSLEVFWDLPFPVANFFNSTRSQNITASITEFFEFQKYLEPEFSDFLNNSRRVIIPCRSNYRNEPEPTLYIRASSYNYHETCIVPQFDYDYEPSLGFIFKEFNLTRIYFIPPCGGSQFIEQKLIFACEASDKSYVGVTLYVTGQEKERLEFLKAFIDILPPDATGDQNYNYLIQKYPANIQPETSERNHFKILSCHFPAECEVRKQFLDFSNDVYLFYEVNDGMWNPTQQYFLQSPNDTFRSGLVRSFKYNGIPPTYEFIFSGLDQDPPKRYLLSENFPKNAIITLKHISPMEYDSIPKNRTSYAIFRCEISNFVLENNIKIYLVTVTRNRTDPEYNNYNNDYESDKNTDDITHESLPLTRSSTFHPGTLYSWEDVFKTEGFNRDRGSTWAEVEVNVTEKFRGIVCTAPWQNSTEWVNATLDVKIPNIRNILGKVASLEYNQNQNETEIKYLNGTAIKFKNGDKISLYCTATPDDSIITWTAENCNLGAHLNDKNLENGSSILEFLEPFNERFVGKYTCSVSNEYGSNSVDFVLEMLNEDGPGLTGAQIAGITVATAALPVLIFVPIFFCFKRYRYIKTELRDLTIEEIQEFLNGQQIDDLPADNGNDMTSPVPNVNIKSLPLDPKFILKEADLAIERSAKLGEGQFGVVYRGLYNEQAVAVKSTKPFADVSAVKQFLSEVQIVAYVAGNCDIVQIDDTEAGAINGEDLGNKNKNNIVSFVGVVIDQLKKRGVLAVFELSPIGNLHSYLGSIRTNGSPEFKNLVIDDELTAADFEGMGSQSKGRQQNQSKITTLDMVDWCSQIAGGMDYLVTKKVIHGDLASRNVLVFPNNVVKITDFGLSKKLYANSQYLRSKDKKIALPWAWMAIESLHADKYSAESDVWSFGVTLWEIFSMGQFPYPGHQFSPHFVTALSNGMRMGKPQYSTSHIYNQMWNCWDAAPENRPTFVQLSAYFNNILQESKVKIVKRTSPSNLMYYKDVAVFVHPEYILSSDA